MSEHVVHGRVGQGQTLGVADDEFRGQSALREILAGQADGRVGQVHADRDCAALRKPHEVHARPAADVQHAFAAKAVERDELHEMMQLVEVVLVEILKKPRRPTGCEDARSWMCSFSRPGRAR